MSSAEIFSNVATLVVLVFVMSLITAPKKGDSAATKTARKIARYTFTGTLVLCVLMGLFALYVVKHK